MKRQTGKRARATTAIGVLIASSILAACGSNDSSSVDPGTAADAPSFEQALNATPPELKQLYANGSELIDGGQAAYDETLASVKGYPVVVNEWASWCGPCRTEFPLFQNQAAEHLDEVAFLGVDTEDSPDAYETFLRDHPIPYPSVADPDGEFSGWADVGLVGLPNTLFYDRNGELIFTHQGPYTDEAALAADIEKYALSS